MRSTELKDASRLAPRQPELVLRARSEHYAARDFDLTNRDDGAVAAGIPGRRASCQAARPSLLRSGGLRRHCRSFKPRRTQPERSERPARLGRAHLQTGDLPRPFPMIEGQLGNDDGRKACMCNSRARTRSGTAREGRAVARTVG